MPVRASMIVCGASGIGKTCMIRRLAEGKFSSTAPTVGVDFGVLRIGSILRLDVYDLSGADCFVEARVDFYRDAVIILFVFDVRSFSNDMMGLESWFDEASRCGLPSTARRFIVGTHCDNDGAGSGRGNAESVEIMKLWASARNSIFFQVGALTGFGVSEALDLLAKSAAEALSEKVGTEKIKTFPAVT